MRGFVELERAAGEGAILDRTILVPARGRRRSGGVGIEDCVELSFLNRGART